MYRGKRLLDLTLTVLGAPIWLPVLAACALVIRVRLGSPVLFRQLRGGLHGRPFSILKFRTMTDERDADGKLLPDAQRLPPFGARLRATSLDELPELLNVLRGDMSLVGPRPLLYHYVSRYSAYHARRHETRPGLTGLAQISGRNSLGWGERFDIDVRYVQDQSLALDLRILMTTLAVVLGGRGVSARGEATIGEFAGYDPD